MNKEEKEIMYNAEMAQELDFEIDEIIEDISEMVVRSLSPLARAYEDAERFLRHRTYEVLAGLTQEVIKTEIQPVSLRDRNISNDDQTICCLRLHMEMVEMRPHIDDDGIERMYDERTEASVIAPYLKEPYSTPISVETYKKSLDFLRRLADDLQTIYAFLDTNDIMKEIRKKSIANTEKYMNLRNEKTRVARAYLGLPKDNLFDFIKPEIQNFKDAMYKEEIRYDNEDEEA